jgi:hypothetical protein
VSAGDIDSHLAGVDEPKRSTLDNIGASPGLLVHAAFGRDSRLIETSFGRTALVVASGDASGWLANRLPTCGFGL